MQTNKSNKMLIFLDLETTGLEVDDKVCSIGLIAIDSEDVIVKYELVNEGKKIPPKASSINHITNEMIKNRATLKESETYKFLQEKNLQTTSIVAHNSSFDLEKLSKVGFHFKGEIIDTLRVTKHLVPECEEFSLQFLKYELKLYKAEDTLVKKYNILEKLFPHQALGDAVVVKLLYDYLQQMATKDEMSTLSFKKVLMQKFSFGKYSGRYIEEIVSIDRGYLEWMLNKVLDLDEDLRYSINYYLRECV